MNYFHLEFEFCKAVEEACALLGRGVRKLRRKPAPAPPPARPGLNPIAYTVALSSALRAFNLTHPIHDILACCAKFEHRDGFATVPGVAMALGCTFNNVDIHISRKPEFFAVNSSHAPRRLQLTPEAVQLLRAIRDRIEKTYQ